MAAVIAALDKNDLLEFEFGIFVFFIRDSMGCDLS
jgi:hypothetical protein